MPFIGFARTFRVDEGYLKCPEFWDELNQKYADLWKTKAPKDDVEKAVLENYECSIWMSVKNA